MHPEAVATGILAAPRGRDEAPCCHRNARRMTRRFSRIVKMANEALAALGDELDGTTGDEAKRAGPLQRRGNTRPRSRPELVACCRIRVIVQVAAAAATAGAAKRDGVIVDQRRVTTTVACTRQKRDRGRKVSRWVPPVCSEKVLRMSVEIDVAVGNEAVEHVDEADSPTWWD
jgi:hypothetical protein